MKKLLLLLCFFVISGHGVGQENLPLEEKLAGFYQRKQYENAEKLLREHLETVPKDVERRVELAGLLKYTGKTEAAIAILQKGMQDKEDDSNLLWKLGLLHLERGNDGPNISRSGGTVAYSPSKMTDEEEADWKKKEFKKAAQTFRKMLTYHPDNESITESLVQGLQGFLPPAELHEEVAKLAEQFPENLEIGLLRVEGLRAAKQWEDASLIIEKFLEGSPRQGKLHRSQAKIFEEWGKKKQAEEAETKANFYSWMPPFAKVAYSKENATRVTALSTKNEELKEIVDRLLEEKSQISDELMAAVCFHHLAHGEIENSCFAELEKRGRGDLLVALVENAQSICTAREGGRALANMKHPKALTLLSQMVASDQRPMWIVDAAGSLEVLGDPEAVTILSETVDPDFRESDRQRGEEEADFMHNGPLNNRLRCILALGAFDTEKSRQTLAKAVSNPELAMTSQFALYRLTRDEKHLEKGMSLIQKDSSTFRYRIIPYLLKLEDEKATEAVTQWQKKRPQKKEE